MATAMICMGVHNVVLKSPSVTKASASSTPSSQLLPQFQGLSCAKISKLEAAKSSLNIQRHTPRTHSISRAGFVVVAMAAAEKLPLLNDLPLLSYINQQGRIQPPIEPNTAATVFAVLDANKKVQYIGFSKDARNSLRTLMGRRPELCFYFKVYNLTTLDQQKMLDIRSTWFSEMGLPPPGNTDPYQRNLWEKPVDAGSISERGKKAAGISKARTLQQTMADRGLKEEMVYDPALIEQGLCDVLASEGQSEEELAAAAAQAEAAAKKTRAIVEKAPGGEDVDFNITFVNKIVTNGGWMFDILITKDDKETRHRVVCGRMFPDSVKLPEDDLIIRVMAFLLHKRIPRQTEGVLTSEQFGINYFAVSEVAQKFDDFKTWFAEDLPETYWRFNRIHSYGNITAPTTPLQPDIYTPQYD